MTTTVIVATSPLPKDNFFRLWGLVLVAMLVLGGIGIKTISPILLSLLAQAMIEAIFATSLGVLHRHNGRVSFGHAAFYGLAAYLATLLFKQTQIPGWVAVLLALALPSALGFVIGLVIARIPGVAHAMLTLVVGQALFEVAFKWRQVTNGDDGLTVAMPQSLFGIQTDLFQMPAVMFVVATCILLLILFGLAILARTHFGALTEAIRDNPERARFIGYGTTLPCAIVYAISAAIAAVAGVLFITYNTFVTPAVLHWTTSGTALVMAIIGGPRILWGPAIGALAFFFLKDLVSDVSTLWPAIVGTVLIVVTLTMPDGIAGLIVGAMERLRSLPRTKR